MTIKKIVFLIDLQNGFMRYDLSPTEGGCLYVPHSEEVEAPVVRMVHDARDTIFILTQDSHPADQISFMENHPGVMADRAARLRARGVPEDRIAAASLDVLTMPFDQALLARAPVGRYSDLAAERRPGPMPTTTVITTPAFDQKIVVARPFTPVAFRRDDAWVGVETANQRIATILGTPFDATAVKDGLLQVLWRQHCVEGTLSALWGPQLMAQLPAKVKAIAVQSPKLDWFMGKDHEKGNDFIVLRKGQRSDLDSYGVATENDGVSSTIAPYVFGLLSGALTRQGLDEVQIGIGGLATDYCVKYSHDDVAEIFVAGLRRHGMRASLTFLPDISRGIAPNTTAAALDAMKAAGTAVATTEAFMRPDYKPRALEAKPNLA
jgi:nicotinamidase-related amidase